MSLWRKLKDVLFGPPPACSPDRVKVKPNTAIYRDLVHSSFWMAAARLEASPEPVFGHKHNVIRFRFVPGTHKRPKGWAISWGNDGWAGAVSGSREIVMAVDPETGALNQSALADAAHEWGHQLLNYRKIALGDIKEQHRILARAGL